MYKINQLFLNHRYCNETLVDLQEQIGDRSKLDSLQERLDKLLERIRDIDKHISKARDNAAEVRHSLLLYIPYRVVPWYFQRQTQFAVFYRSFICLYFIPLDSINLGFVLPPFITYLTLSLIHI